MVSALLNDALSDPSSVIFSLHHDQTSSRSSQRLASRVAQHFKSIFKDDDAFKQIPVLNATHVPKCVESKILPFVRFRAMVQDTSASPEVYPVLLRNGAPGGWGLAEAEAMDGLFDMQHLDEREVVWAVSVPGESPFVAELLDDVEDVPTSNVELTASKLPHKDPLMRANHIGVQVKLYDSSVAPMKPTELHTFVGLLTVESLLSGEQGTHDDLQVLTLHTLFSVQHTPMLVPLKYFPPNHVTSSASRHYQVDPAPSTVRDELIQWMSEEALGGDRDAALWVLLVAIARVRSRQSALLPPSLTLSRFPRPDGALALPTPALAHVLRCLLPIFVNVPFTLSLMNTRSFSPESRDESLHAGLLQLPAGSTIMLSDSGVQEGTITETGLKNIQALRNAITTQTVNYHFPFASPYQFPTDLSFIILTEGKKSAFIETVVNIPLECRQPQDCFRRPEHIRMPSGGCLDTFRRLLGSAQVGDVKITDEMSQHIQEDFVQERQKDKTVSAEDLMTRMSVARLLALLLHSPVLTTEVWKEAKELDQRRKKRL